MRRVFVRLMSEEDGATMVEYALMVGLIAVVVIIGATALGTAVNGKFTSIGTTVTGAASGGGD